MGNTVKKLFDKIYIVAIGFAVFTLLLYGLWHLIYAGIHFTMGKGSAETFAYCVPFWMFFTLALCLRAVVFSIREQ